MSSGSDATTTWKKSDKPKAPACHHFAPSWDNHPYCLKCRQKQGLDCTREVPCPTCSTWSDRTWELHTARIQLVSASKARSTSSRHSKKSSKSASASRAAASLPRASSAPPPQTQIPTPPPIPSAVVAPPATQSVPPPSVPSGGQAPGPIYPAPVPGPQALGPPASTSPTAWPMGRGGFPPQPPIWGFPPRPPPWSFACDPWAMTRAWAPSPWMGTHVNYPGHSPVSGAGGVATGHPSPPAPLPSGSMRAPSVSPPVLTPGTASGLMGHPPRDLSGDSGVPVAGQTIGSFGAPGVSPPGLPTQPRPPVSSAPSGPILLSAQPTAETPGPSGIGGRAQVMEAQRLVVREFAESLGRDGVEAQPSPTGLGASRSASSAPASARPGPSSAPTPSGSGAVSGLSGPSGPSGPSDSAFGADQPPSTLASAPIGAPLASELPPAGPTVLFPSGSGPSDPNTSLASALARPPLPSGSSDPRQGRSGRDLEPRKRPLGTQQARQDGPESLHTVVTLASRPPPLAFDLPQANASSDDSASALGVPPAKRRILEEFLSSSHKETPPTGSPSGGGDSEDDSEEEQRVVFQVDVEKSRLRRWNSNVSSIRTLLQSSIPSDTPVTPTKAPRVQDPMAPSRSTTKAERLPLHPELASVLDKLAKEVKEPAQGKSRKTTSTLPACTYPEGAFKFRPDCLAPAGFSNFATPATLTEDFASLSSDGTITLSSQDSSSEAELQTEERWVRELLCIHNALRWTQQAKDTLALQCRSYDGQTLALMMERLRDLGDQSRSLELHLEDRLTTRFVTTVLKRRDLHLKSLQGRQDQRTLESLRASSFTDRHLFSEVSPADVAYAQSLQREDNLSKLVDRAASAPSQAPAQRSAERSGSGGQRVQTQGGKQGKASHGQGKAQTHKPFKRRGKGKGRGKSTAQKSSTPGSDSGKGRGKGGKPKNPPSKQ